MKIEENKILEYIKEPEKINQYYDFAPEEFIEHLENQYDNLLHFIKKYPYNYRETLIALKFIILLLKQEPRYSYLLYKIGFIKIKEIR